MRGALQTRGARLPISISGLPRPSWPRLTTLRRRQVTGEELETIERLSRELRNARRSGAHAPEPVVQRHWL
jgi:hypothetical protein